MSIYSGQSEDRERWRELVARSSVASQTVNKDYGRGEGEGSATKHNILIKYWNKYISDRLFGSILADRIVLGSLPSALEQPDPVLGVPVHTSAYAVNGHDIFPATVREK
jgi:hypothetical protein